MVGRILLSGEIFEGTQRLRTSLLGRTGGLLLLSVLFLHLLVSRLGTRLHESMQALGCCRRRCRRHR